MVNVLRFLGMQHSYFFNHKSKCSLCGAEQPPSLSHLLLECTATTEVCKKHDVPAERVFLRCYLLGLTGVELSNLCADVMSVLDAGATTNTAGRSNRRRDTALIPCAPRALLLQECITMRFDGSYQGGTKSGIGITLQLSGSEPFAKFSVPLTVKDAQRAEMCGPTLGALLLSTLPPAQVVIEGDSKYIIGLLNRKWPPKESYFMNATQLCLDQLKGWEKCCTWIPRDLNSTCDALARAAVANQVVEVWCNDEWRDFKEPWL